MKTSNNQDYLSRHTTPVPQHEALENQVANSAGGYSYKPSSWDSLRQFLILGSGNNTYYASSKDLTKENIDNVVACIREDGPRVVAITKEISLEGRAPKNDPAIYVLALCASADAETRKAALASLEEVCRTGTHLFTFLKFIKPMRGLGRSLRSAIANWYQNKDVDKLGYQMVKYRQRYGWSHADALRISHPIPDDEHKALYAWATGKDVKELDLPRVVYNYERLSVATKEQAVELLQLDSNLPWEAIPTEFHNEKTLWEVLLTNGLPTGALIRQLPRLTKLGLFKEAPKEFSYATLVVGQLTDQESLVRARIHPLQILNALSFYKYKGGRDFDPDNRIIDALDEAFYLSFKGLEPTGKRWMISLDVSASMGFENIANSALNPREASTALALCQLSTGDSTVINAFSDGLTPLNLSSRQRLDDAISTVSGLRFGGTDCALPMVYAKEQGLEIDVFSIYTDSETYVGRIHPSEALKDYRRSSGINAKLIVNGMVSNGFSIADQNDPGMLDVVGFDSAAPQVMAAFAKGGFDNE